MKSPNFVSYYFKQGYFSYFTYNWTINEQRHRYLAGKDQIETIEEKN